MFFLACKWMFSLMSMTWGFYFWICSSKFLRIKSDGMNRKRHRINKKNSKITPYKQCKSVNESHANHTLHIWFEHGFECCLINFYTWFFVVVQMTRVYSTAATTISWNRTWVNERVWSYPLRPWIVSHGHTLNIVNYVSIDYHAMCV